MVIEIIILDYKFFTQFIIGFELKQNVLVLSELVLSEQTSALTRQIALFINKTFTCC